MTSDARTMTYETMLPGFAQSYGAASSVLTENAEPFANAVIGAQFALLGLMSRRAQAYMAWPTRVASCRTPQDIVSAQQNFWQTCVADYGQAGQAIGDVLLAGKTVTGLGETIDDESLASCPHSPKTRDVLHVQSTNAQQALREPQSDALKNGHQRQTAA
ncbi:MAG: hypothetical protein ACR2PG_05885 [Hyphomicrobiaceae bacterium]